MSSCVTFSPHGLWHSCWGLTTPEPFPRLLIQYFLLLDSCQRWWSIIRPKWHSPASCSINTHSYQSSLPLCHFRSWERLSIDEDKPHYFLPTSTTNLEAVAGHEDYGGRCRQSVAPDSNVWALTGWAGGVELDYDCREVLLYLSVSLLLALWMPRMEPTWSSLHAFLCSISGSDLLCEYDIGSRSAQLESLCWDKVATAWIPATSTAI